MKTILPPAIEYDRLSYSPRLTEEFKQVIKTAMELLLPFCEEEIDNVPNTIAYFSVKGDSIAEYDCCDNTKCINIALRDIRLAYGKYTRVVTEKTHNDSDHESLDRCYSCEQYLNEFLTWVNQEWEYLEQEEKNWDIDFFRKESFAVYCVLQALPSCDKDISEYEQNNKDKLKAALKRREDFYNELSEMVLKVIECLKPETK